jgi:predicted nucleic acid-binding protein
LIEPFILRVQASDEFAAVGRRKLGMSRTDIEYAFADLMAIAASIVPIDEQTPLSALDLAQQ